MELCGSKGGQIAHQPLQSSSPRDPRQLRGARLVDTDLNEAVFSNEKFKEKLTEAIPLQRIATADDVACR